MAIAKDYYETLGVPKGATLDEIKNPIESLQESIIPIW